MQKNSSSSDFILSDLDIDTSFTELSEVTTAGFNRLVKAKRYGKWYMLKCLKPEYQSQRLYQELLRKEFEISISMDHPNIVHTIGIEHVDGLGLCIIFEYLEGTTLKTFLTEKHSRNEKARLSDELIEALSYLHRKQIVHRDLKPENLIVTTNGNNLKLIDFGLADTDAHAILKQPAGTKNYISPEQRSATVADCRNDIYSLGKILIELNAGLVYRRVAKHCLRDIDHRYANAEAVMLQIRKHRTLRRYFSFSFILLPIVLFFLLFLTERNLLDDKQRVNHVIENGKHLVDQLNLPLQQYYDTVSITYHLNNSTYFNSISQKRLRDLDHLYDSLSEGFDGFDKNVIINVLKIYSAESTPIFKWNDKP